VNRRVHVLAVVADVHHDPLDQAADDRLAIRVGRARGVPERRDVRGERRDACLFIDRERHGSFACEPIVFFLNLLLLTERFLPVLFQRSRDEAIARIDGAITTFGQLDFVPRSFEPLPPLLTKPFPLALEVGARL